jgi:hypothetical protein
VEMPVVDTEFVKAKITAPAASLAAITGVRAAFLLHDGSPTDTDWIDAELVDGAVRVLIGPSGGRALPAATYRMWAEITAPTELVRRPCPGVVNITP